MEMIPPQNYTFGPILLGKKKVIQVTVHVNAREVTEERSTIYHIEVFK